MDIRLVVVRAFGVRAKGDVVTDADEISKILADERAANVVRVAVPTQGG
jgi:hypothetical protein